MGLGAADGLLLSRAVLSVAADTVLADALELNPAKAVVPRLSAQTKAPKPAEMTRSQVVPRLAPIRLWAI